MGVDLHMRRTKLIDSKIIRKCTFSPVQEKYFCLIQLIGLTRPKFSSDDLNLI